MNSIKQIFIPVVLVFFSNLGVIKILAFASNRNQEYLNTFHKMITKKSFQ